MKNVYKFSGGAGETRPGLKFDVVKVRGREEDRENIAHTEVITITESSTEDAVGSWSGAADSGRQRSGLPCPLLLLCGRQLR